MGDASSPPPEREARTASPQPNLTVPAASQPTPPTQTSASASASASRKRKRAPPPPAASPAPSDPGNGNAPPNPPELLSTRADLSSRPQLSISRGPVFVSTSEGSDYHRTDLVAVNRLGFRYLPAGINPVGHVLPCRTIESNPTAYRISWEDRSSFITVTKDGLGLRGDGGFRSARCNAPIVEGRWYMEVKILHGGGEHHTEDGRREGSHVRLGWGRREAPLNGPAGLDGYSYGYRDKTGDKITLSRPRPYGRPYGTGDVVGMYISLPPRRQADKKDPNDPAHVKRERIPIDLKGQEVFEILEYTQSKEMSALMDYSSKSTNTTSVPSAPKKSKAAKLERSGPTNTPKANAAHLRLLPALENSRIAFFVNGECQGTAFQDIYDYLQLRQSETSRKGKEKKRVREGVKEHRENPFNDGTLGYYPFISLFNDAAVRLNPGPDFEFPPPPDVDALLDGTTPEGTEQTWRPTCERYPEFMAEQWALDAIEEEEARVEASRAAATEKAEAAKKAERSKKRKQAEARKRAKLGATEQQQLGTPTADELLSSLPGLGQPSPLRHGTTYEDVEEFPDFIHSPAPTFASNGDPHGGPSGYNSDSMDMDGENADQGTMTIPSSSHLETPT